MTAIAPNSTIIIGRSLLRKDSEDTYYWDDPNDQIDHIIHWERGTWTECSYQRERRNYIRVQGNAEDYDDCNYLRFRNINYDHQSSPKWFFAFILDIEYINNETMEIHYEIDNVQTYYFDYHEDTCYVERCHSLTDEIGDNILPETVECGEYIGNGTPINILSTAPYSSMWYVVIQVHEVEGKIKNQIVDNILQGAWLYAFPCTVQGLQELDTFFEGQQIADNVIDLYIVHGSNVYGKFVGGGTSGLLEGNTYGLSFHAAINPPLVTDTLDGYLPKNKKLYTYPYSYADISNGSGDSLTLRYEFFYRTQHEGGFTFNGGVDITGTVSDPPEMILYPAGYKGTTSLQDYYKESISLPSLPHCTWSHDTFKEWLSTQVVGLGLGAVSSVLAAQAGPVLTGMARLATVPRTKKGNIDRRYKIMPEFNTPELPQASYLAVGALVSQGYSASLKNGTSKGNPGTTSITSTGSYGFWYTRMSVTKQYAKMIDDFFTLYGYANNSLIPNSQPLRKRRSRYTYIKTVDCNIVGSIPNEAYVDICERYDRGIRFWADHAYMYNYTYDNEVLS